jgi:hypothetical protein
MCVRIYSYQFKVVSICTSFRAKAPPSRETIKNSINDCNLISTNVIESQYTLFENQGLNKKTCLD